MQASVPLGNTSHFPPFKQVSPGWEQRRPGEGQERSALPAPPGALPTPHLLSWGYWVQGAPRKPCMNPEGTQHSAQSAGVREEARRNRLVGWQVDRSRSKCVGAGGGKKWPEMQCRQQGRNAGMTLGQSPKLLTPHPSFTRDLGWAGAPIQPPGLSCCSNKFFQGVALGGGGGAGHTQLPRSWENATAARAAAPPANKAPGGGIRAAHCRARATSWGTRTAPQGPDHASTDTQHRFPRVGIFSGSLPPNTARVWGG